MGRRWKLRPLMALSHDITDYIKRDRKPVQIVLLLFLHGHGALSIGIVLSFIFGLMILKVS